MDRAILFYKDKRGYDGSCLPKDISSLAYQGKENGTDVSLLEVVIKKNNNYIKQNEE